MQAVNDYKQAGGEFTGFDQSRRASKGCRFALAILAFFLAKHISEIRAQGSMQRPTANAHLGNSSVHEHCCPCSQDLEAPPLPEREYEASKRYFGTLGDAMLSCLARAHGERPLSQVFS